MAADSLDSSGGDLSLYLSLLVYVWMSILWWLAGGGAQEAVMSDARELGAGDGGVTTLTT